MQKDVFLLHRKLIFNFTKFIIFHNQHDLFPPTWSCPPSWSSPTSMIISHQHDCFCTMSFLTMDKGENACSRAEAATPKWSSVTLPSRRPPLPHFLSACLFVASDFHWLRPGAVAVWSRHHQRLFVSLAFPSYLCVLANVLVSRLVTWLGSLASEGAPSRWHLPLVPPGVNNPGNYRLVRVIYLRILYY